MLKNEKPNIKNTFYSSLVLLFTLSSFLKIDYSPTIAIDFGGYSTDTEVALNIDPDKTTSFNVFRYLNDTSESTFEYSSDLHFAKIQKFYKLKINRYIFPQALSSKYQHPDFIPSIRIIKMFCISHHSPDDSDPLIS